MEVGDVLEPTDFEFLDSFQNKARNEEGWRC